MPYSYATYAGNGSAVTFGVPFAYLSRSHVEVRVNNVLQSGVTWDSAATVRLPSAPANGTLVEVRRNTPKAAPLVDFSDGSVLTESLLDTSALQSFYISQEALDAAADAVTFAQGLTIAVGNTPPPALGDVGKLLRATGVGTVAWADSAEVRAAAGATTVGAALLTAAAENQARSALGATLTGGALFTAGSQSAARTAIGMTATGSSVVTAADAPAARTAIGAAPLPTVSGGSSPVVPIETAAGAAATAPATAGQYFAFAVALELATGELRGSPVAGIFNAGATIIAGVAGRAVYGFTWKVS